MSLSPATVWRIGAGFGVSSVTLGAFGAHGLSSRVPEVPARALKNWETASSYLLVHGAVLLGVSLHPRFVRSRAPVLLALGTVLFSGSIYGLVLGPPALRKVLGPVTPLGGLLIIAGWTTLLF